MGALRLSADATMEIAFVLTLPFAARVLFAKETFPMEIVTLLACWR
jgi:hypothetical protein